MNELKRSKIEKFLNDEAMSDVIFSELQASFLKGRANKDVHYLAAKSLAVEFLDEAFKDLNKHRNIAPEGGQVRKQIGL